MAVGKNGFIAAGLTGNGVSAKIGSLTPFLRGVSVV
jgi:hypothetical protein